MDNFESDLQMKGAAYHAAPIEPTKLLNANITTASNLSGLQALRIAPETRISLRHDFGIMQPQTRIKELRNMAYVIDTVGVFDYTPDNIKHFAVAKNVLRGIK